jgi:hypothetical protein
MLLARPHHNFSKEKPNIWPRLSSSSNPGSVAQQKKIGWRKVKHWWFGLAQQNGFGSSMFPHTMMLTTANADKKPQQSPTHLLLIG